MLHALLLLLASPTAEAITALEGALAEKHVENAVSALAKISGAFPQATDEEKKAAVTAVGGAVKFPDLRVRHGAFSSLAAMRAKGSSKYLGKWLNPPNDLKAEDPTSYVEALRTAGAIADGNTLDPIEKLSDHRDTEIAGAATEALGGFRSLPLVRKKKLAFDLVDRLAQLSSTSRRADWSEGGIARRVRLGQASGAALRALTGKSYESADAWKAWKEEAERQRDPFA